MSPGYLMPKLSSFFKKGLNLINRKKADLPLSTILYQAVRDKTSSCKPDNHQEIGLC